MSVTDIPIYIEVIDGKYEGARGYIKRPARTKFICIVYMNKLPLEVTLDKSEFKKIVGGK